MVGLIATLKVRPATVEKFEGCFTALAQKVRALESGTRLYQLLRSQNEPNVYRVVEIYASDEALSQHMKSPHLLEAMAVLRDCLAGPPDIERLDVVGAPEGT